MTLVVHLIKMTLEVSRRLIDTLDSICHPTKETTRAVLGKGLPGFVGLNGDISMMDSAGRDKDG